MQREKMQLPTDFQSYLAGIFWQQWEIDFDGDPVSALRAAGYPAENNSKASRALEELLKWIEDSSDLKNKFPSLVELYDYEADGLTLLEFLVLTKKFIDGNVSAFDDNQK